MQECDLYAVLGDISEFHCVISESSAEQTVLRCAINNIDEAREWVGCFGDKTRTNWIAGRQRQKEPQRHVLHNLWVCHHSNRNKVPSSKRATACKASIDILIKKNNYYTRRNDPYLQQSPALCGKITINMRHNHIVGSEGSLKNLRVTEKVKAAFRNFFNAGMSPSEAIRAHENSILLMDNSVEALANGSINPIRRAVYTMHDAWKKENFGPVSSPFEKLREKVLNLSEEGTFVAIKEEHPYSVLVVTDIMKRAQAMSCSKETIFICSSSSCDTTSATVTVLLTATTAGAIPIGIIINESQSEEGYTKGFTLLQENFPECFGGEKEPKIFMTDDSAAEKSALQAVWPCATQFLCHSHMARAEWRWLISTKNGVNKESRKELMKLFQNVMKADTSEKLADAKLAINELQGQDNFVYRMRTNLSREEEWVQYHQIKLISGNNDSNNYAEASIRLLKDVIISRTKGFNIVALVDFYGTILNEYFKARLLNFAHGRPAEPVLGYSVLCKQMAGIDLERIKEVSDGAYSVPSATLADTDYIVDVHLCVCSCVKGSNGTFCKHQAILHKHKDVLLPILPPITLQGRYSLAQLALGNKCPEILYFKELKDIGECEFTFISCPDISQSGPSSESDYSEMEIPTESSNRVIAESSNDDIAMTPVALVCAQFERIKSFVTASSDSNMEWLAKHLSQIQNETDLNTAIAAYRECRAATCRQGDKVKVQPRSIAPRRDGLTQGSSRIPAGTPPVATASLKTRKRARQS